MKIVECVPNFSEGRDMNIINSITSEIEKVEGVKLLDVDPGKDTNRTVVTFVGSPDGVLEAAFRAIKRASELIDMKKHKGAHPRIGATDVCPFVPVSGVSMQDCVELAHKLGKRVGEELQIPVYLYEEAATSPERKSLSNIRKGEYEALCEKLKDPEWKPDYGPSEFSERVAKTGATVIGAREFLIAYNVNLNTKDRKLAHEIALNIRETGRLKRDENGKIVRNPDGTPVRVPGRLKAVRAVGWYIDEYGFAQVSINVMNYKITPLHVIFDTVCEEAEKLGLRVIGSEIVGLCPKEALIQAGKHYLLKQKRCPGIPEKQIIEIAILSLGLSQIERFDPEKKIIEFYIEKKGRLENMTIRDFEDELSTDSPAPGGGSVSALAASNACSLISMVANLTYNKKGYEDVTREMGEVAEKAQKLKDEFIKDIDRDTEVFENVMKAFRLPKKTEEEIKKREEEIEKATKEATKVPFEVLKRLLEVLDITKIVAEKGNENAVSDAGVAASQALSAAEGAYLNVLINLKNIKDEEFKTEIRKESDRILESIKKEKERVEAIVKKRLGEEV